MTKIEDIKDQILWDNFLDQCPEKTFLHSWQWAEFRIEMGEKIWRRGFYSDGNLSALVLILKVKARRGTFLFIPHGPIVKDKKVDSEFFDSLCQDLKKIAGSEKAAFVRIAPLFPRDKETSALFRNHGFVSAPIHAHAEVTWELDISAPEEQLLAGMRKTTRYLIRQAMKNTDVEIIKSRQEADIDQFNKVYQETVARHHFAPFTLQYLKREFSAFSKDDNILLFLGRYQGTVVSSAMIVFWKGGAYYHHGGSLSQFNKVPVSYLLQWEAIREAKARDCRIYNFWGIAPELKNEKEASFSKHPWAGLTLFKMGFGGYRKEYLKTQDMPLSSRYWLVFLFEIIRKFKRGL